MASTSNRQGGRRYDAFFSHAGQEKLQIVSHLLDRFEKSYPEVHVFVDDWSLPPGENAEENMLQAIDECGVFIPVLSQAFVRKEWPMLEVKRIHERVERDGDAAVSIIPVFHHNITYKELQNLSELVYCKRAPCGLTLEEGLDKEQVQADIKWLLQCTGCRPDQDARAAEAAMVPRVVEDAVMQLERLGRLRLGAQEPTIMFGREEDIEYVSKLRAGGAVVLMYGPPGIGKTTLADATYERLLPEFLLHSDAVCWRISLRGVGPESSVLPLQKRFMQGGLRLEGLALDSVPDEKSARERIAARLRGRLLLLLIDDMQSARQLSRLLPVDLLEEGFLAPGSLVLLTARTADVVVDYEEKFRELSMGSTTVPGARQSDMPASGVKQHAVGQLQAAAEWALFCWHVKDLTLLDQMDPELNKQLEAAVRRCNKLPLMLTITARQIGHEVKKAEKAGRHGQSALRTALQRLSNAVSRYLQANPGSNAEEPLESNFSLLSPEEKDLLLDVAVFWHGQPWAQALAYGDVDLITLQEMGLVRDACAGSLRMVEMHDYVREFCRQKASTIHKRRIVLDGTFNAAAWEQDVRGLHVSRVLLPDSSVPFLSGTALRHTLEHRLLIMADVEMSPSQQPELKARGRAAVETAAQEEVRPAAGVLKKLEYLRLQQVRPTQLAKWLIQAVVGAALRVVVLCKMPWASLDVQVLGDVEYLSLADMPSLTALTGLEQLRNLASLELVGCAALEGKLRTVADTCKPLHTHLAACPKLTGVIREGHVQALAIADCPSLEQLCFTATEMVKAVKVAGGHMVRELLGTLQQCTGLEELVVELAPAPVPAVSGRADAGLENSHVKQQHSSQDGGCAVFVTRAGEHQELQRRLHQHFQDACPGVQVHFDDYPFDDNSERQSHEGILSYLLPCYDHPPLPGGKSFLEYKAELNAENYADTVKAQQASKCAFTECSVVIKIEPVVFPRAWMSELPKRPDDLLGADISSTQNLRRELEGSDKYVIPVLYNMDQADMERLEQDPNFKWLLQQSQPLGNKIGRPKGSEVLTYTQLVERIVACTVSQLMVVGRLSPEQSGMVPLPRRVDRIKGLLEEHPMQLLHGMAGSGKTVMLAAIHLQAPALGDFQVAVMLQLQHSSSPEDICRAQQQLLKEAGHGITGIAVWDPKRNHYRLRRALQGKKVWLVVDNVWKGQLQLLLPRDIMQHLHKGSKVLVASRERDAAEDFPGCSSDPLPELTFEEAVQVFQAHYGQAATADSRRAAVQTIVDRCNRIPMALALVAKLLVHEPHLWGDLDAALPKAFSSSVANARNASDGHTMNEAVRTSYGRLSRDEQLALQRTAKHLQGKREEEVAACLGEGVLQALVARGLLGLSAGRSQHATVEVHEAVLCFFENLEQQARQTSEGAGRTRAVATDWYVTWPVSWPPSWPKLEQPAGERQQAAVGWLQLQDAVWLSLDLTPPLTPNKHNPQDYKAVASSALLCSGQHGSPKAVKEACQRGLSGDILSAPCVRVLHLQALHHLTVQLQALSQLRLVTLRSLPYLHHLNLVALANLEHLEISSCRCLTKLAGLGAHTTLRRLHLAALPQLDVLSGLGRLAQLQKLNLDGLRSMTALEDLRALSALTMVQMRGMRRLRSLGGLGQLQQLRDVELEGVGEVSELPDVKALARLTRLRWRKEPLAVGQTW